MGIMNLFSGFGKKRVTKTDAGDANTETTTATVPLISKPLTVNPARRMRKQSCRERKAGHVSSSGRFLSKFDIYLLARQGMALPSMRQVFGHQAMRWAVTGR